MGDADKAASRGASRDMSPEAIARRFAILDELEELARTLARARRVVAHDLTDRIMDGSRETPPPASE